MDIKTFKTVCLTAPASKAIMVKGVHGIGKTQIVNQLAKEWGMECVTFQAPQVSDVGDVIGLQKIETDEYGNSSTQWCAPYWYNKNKPVVLFLDEINRGTPTITNALMQLALEQKILNFNLPEGTRIICAVNPSDEGEYDVEEFDPAKADRFAVYELKPTTQEWLDWAVTAGIHPSITGYIAEYRNSLDPYSSNRPQDASGILPSRRSWVTFSEHLYNLEKHFNGEMDLNILQDVLAGYVGNSIAIEFRTYYSQVSTVSPKGILDATEKDWVKLNKAISDMNKRMPLDATRLAEGVIQLLAEKEVNNEIEWKRHAMCWKNFLLALPMEQRSQAYNNGLESARKANRKWVGKFTREEPILTKMYNDIIDIDIQTMANAQ